MLHWQPACVRGGFRNISSFAAMPRFQLIPVFLPSRRLTPMDCLKSFRSAQRCCFNRWQAAMFQGGAYPVSQSAESDGIQSGHQAPRAPPCAPSDQPNAPSCEGACCGWRLHTTMQQQPCMIIQSSTCCQLTLSCYMNHNMFLVSRVSLI